MLFNKLLRRNPENQIEKKWNINFSKPEKFSFNIKSESLYNANLSENTLTLELKKQNCIVWEEIPEREYFDHIINAKIRLDYSGGYIASGILFHIDKTGAYYMMLVSTKGYFRVDAVKDSAPHPLIAWTEIPDFDGNDINLNITVYETRFIFVINGKWAGDADNNLARSGKIAFAIASYETDKTPDYSAKAYLENLSIDTRTKAIEENLGKWTNEYNINADSRLRLSETFAVMGDASRSLEQIKLAWKRREDAFRSVSGAFNEIRTKRELLLAARMSFSLGQYQEADDYLSTLLDQWLNTPEGTEAVNEKVKTLNELNKFSELKVFAEKHGSLIKKNADMYSLLASCYWNLKDYKNSANV
ncbi:MAG: hypothetical protein LBB81_04335, partial [Treponema sp.]|nr:hypothetical protein [Treponema sp.]